VKFEGSLDAFSLPDIFQLLSFTKKSGGLRLRQGRAEGVVWFVDGLVTGATSDVAHQALARRIAGIGLVAPEAFRAAVEHSVSTGGSTGVARALLDVGQVDAELLHATVAAQATDAVSELLRWPTGDFALVEGANPDDVGVVLASDAIVAEAVARSAAWEALAEVLPSPDVVLVLRPVAPEQDTLVTPEEWSLLSLVDGRRTVGAIVALTGRGQFSVVSTLAELVRRGLLHPRDGQDPVAALESALALLAPLEAPSAPGQEPGGETWVPPTAPSVPQLVVPVAPTAPASPAAPAASREPSHAATSSLTPPGPFTAPPTAPVAPTTPVPAMTPGARPAPVLGATSNPQHATQNTVAALPDVEAPVRSMTFALTPQDAPEVLGLAAIDVATTAKALEAIFDEDDFDAEAVQLPRLGGAHVPGDVVPPRAEPVLPARQPDYPEAVPPPAARLAGLASVGGGGGAQGSAATAANPQTSSLIERDPSVNRSLLLRLIAGVRGL
jgi:Domain of unknown function (DUF4388)